MDNEMTMGHIKALRDFLKEERPPQPFIIGAFHPNDPYLAYLKSIGAKEAPGSRTDPEALAKVDAELSAIYGPEPWADGVGKLMEPS